jgi:hypothetical protein
MSSSLAKAAELVTVRRQGLAVIVVRRSCRLQDELVWAAAGLHKASRRKDHREYITRKEVVQRLSQPLSLCDLR